MMGERKDRQDRLFYKFCLEDVIPADHPLRTIDAVLDLDWLRRELRPFYSHTGRPSVDPELMIRMMVIGYCYSIRSDRRLCQAIGLDLAYRWFCRLGLEDRVPDHSTFSVNRHGRFRDSDIRAVPHHPSITRRPAIGPKQGALAGYGSGCWGSSDSNSRARRWPSKIASRIIRGA